MPASARRSLYFIDTYCEPLSLWWTSSFRSGCLAYARLLGLSLHLTRELDNVSEVPNTGNSGDGHYGFFVDFADADPEHVVRAIQAKHGKLLFEVGASFFDNVAHDL